MPLARPLAQLASVAGRSEARRSVDWLHLALVPLLAASQLAATEDRPDLAFAVVLALYASYAVVRLTRPVHPTARNLTDALTVAVDLGAISVLAGLSGGGLSLVWHAYLLLPIATAFEYRPVVSAVVGASCAGAYLLQSAVQASVSDEPTSWGVVMVRLGYLLWITAACTALAEVLSRRGARVRRLLDARSQLLVDALDADDAARARVAEALHDHALQDLLVARQELEEAAAQVGTAAVDPLQRAQAAVELTRRDLRAAVADLHPYVLDAVGLRDALTRTAEDAARRGRFALDLDLADDVPEGDDSDRLLLSAARELLSNVVTHARASRVGVALRAVDGGRARELVVRDDGVGADPAALDAVARGHLGVATQRARVEAAGGSVAVTSAPGKGTEVRIRAPLAAATPR